MPYDYHLPPPTPVRPVEMMKKYFFIILFIKSYVYNVKGQAIIFRRKSLESMMTLINDFDETYLHSSYEHSYQNKALSEGNVDFLVKYTDHLDEVISLIDQNAYTIKLSWQPKRVPQPYPPQPIPPHPPIHPTPPPPPPGPGIAKMIEKAVEKAICKQSSEHIKRVKIVKVHKDTKIVEVRQWDDINKKYTTMQKQINIGAYTNGAAPDWRPGDDALLIDDKYLQRINDTPNYRRVKVTNVDLIASRGLIGVVDFDDVTKRATSTEYYVDLKTYSYGKKVPAWHVNDDALLFDNKYLQKLDVPQVTEGTINIIDRGLDWSDAEGKDNQKYGWNPDYNQLNPFDEDGNDQSQKANSPSGNYDVISGMGGNEYNYDDYSYPSNNGNGGSNSGSNNGTCPCNPNTNPNTDPTPGYPDTDDSGYDWGDPDDSYSGDCPTPNNPYHFSSDDYTPGNNDNPGCGCGG